MKHLKGAYGNPWGMLREFKAIPHMLPPNSEASLEVEAGRPITVNRSHRSGLVPTRHWNAIDVLLAPRDAHHDAIGWACTASCQPKFLQITRYGLYSR